ncbi:MAG: ABC transporter permease, partial [Pannonibacter indicus]
MTSFSISPAATAGPDAAKRLPLTLLVSLAILITAAAWAAAPDLFTSYSGTVGLKGNQLQPPSATHLLGTDELGRDLLARIIHGTRYSLSGAFVAVSIGLVTGSLIGLIAGTSGSRVDALLMRMIDVLLAVPTLLLSLAIIIILGFGHVQAAIAVGATAIASFARLMRSDVISVWRADYVEAAFASGARTPAVLWRHVLPNALTSVLALAALQFGWAILQISTLGFLGYGAPPPTPDTPAPSAAATAAAVAGSTVMGVEVGCALTLIMLPGGSEPR